MLRPRTQPAHARVTAGRVLAVLLALHGYAHFVGTTDNLRQLDEHGAAHLLGVTVTGSGLLGLALLWTAIGIGFMLAAALVWTADPHAIRMVTGFAAVSLALCLTSLWGAWIGVLINAVLLGATWFPDRIGLAGRRP